MTAAELLTVLTAVICCGALLNSLTPLLLWRRALAERPGHSTKPSALHQASAAGTGSMQNCRCEQKLQDVHARSGARLLHCWTRWCNSNLPPKFETSDGIFWAGWRGELSEWARTAVWSSLKHEPCQHEQGYAFKPELVLPLTHIEKGFSF